MKTIGLIGGTTWHSTIDYYKIINQEVNHRFGKSNSARIVLYSINLQELRTLVDEKKYDLASQFLCSVAQKIELAGAECLAICANTPHKFADDIRKSVNIPFIHIAEVTAAEIKKKNISKIGLLGTKVTMEDNFYRDILLSYQIESIIPDDEDREFIQYSIFSEMGNGIFKSETKQKYFDIFNKLIGNGAEGIIYGCTEIPLLINEQECPATVFDTLKLHAKSIVDFASNE